MTRPIIALDFSSFEETLDFLDLFDESLYVKIGMESYLLNGPHVIRTIQERGHQIFLDLKLHDIPNTVERTMRGLAELGVDMVNVHAQGGSKMMQAAVEAYKSVHPSGTVLAVTQLTSLSEEQFIQETKSQLSLEENIIHYAQLAQQSGIDGVVCSPLESEAVHAACGKAFLTVTPGIRLSDAQADDQSRVVTPNRARQLESDYIVVGRPITLADDPVQAYQQIKANWEGQDE